MQNQRFLPKGAASFSLDYDGPPKKFAFLLLPNTTLLAFSAAIEPLRMANQLTRKRLFEWYVMSTDGDPVVCSNGISIGADSGLQVLERGSAAFVCSGTEPALACDDRVLGWIRRQRSHGISVGGICTGAFALAEAGALDGRRFTVHWENVPSFRELFPGLEPTQNLYETDRGLRTCGGGHAATDMMLEIIEETYGSLLATSVADMCLHKRATVGMTRQVSAVSAVLGSRNKKLISAIRIMQENLEEPLEMEEIARRVAVSRRQLERLYQKHAGRSPWQFYFQLRLERAYSLLNETDMSVREIAIASGFGNAQHFARQFKRMFAISPHSYRKTWTLAAKPEQVRDSEPNPDRSFVAKKSREGFTL